MADNELEVTVLEVDTIDTEDEDPIVTPTSDATIVLPTNDIVTSLFAALLGDNTIPFELMEVMVEVERSIVTVVHDEPSTSMAAPCEESVAEFRMVIPTDDNEPATESIVPAATVLASITNPLDDTAPAIRNAVLAL